MNIYTLTITLYLTILSTSYLYIQKLGFSNFAQVILSEPLGIAIIASIFFSSLYVGYYKYIR
jgi:hypothetical protein